MKVLFPYWTFQLHEQWLDNCIVYGANPKQRRSDADKAIFKLPHLPAAEYK